MKNHYKLLGVREDATLSEIRHAFRQLAKECHPDTTKSCDDDDRFIQIRAAYDTLSDSCRRSRYDDDLRQSRRRSTRQPVSPVESFRGSPSWDPVPPRTVVFDVGILHRMVDEIIGGLFGEPPATASRSQGRYRRHAGWQQPSSSDWYATGEPEPLRREARTDEFGDLMQLIDSVLTVINRRFR